MDQSVAELSSVGTQLEDITRRVLDAAKAYESDSREDVSHELYEVERALRTATRRLNRAVRSV